MLIEWRRALQEVQGCNYPASISPIFPRHLTSLVPTCIVFHTKPGVTLVLVLSKGLVSWAPSSFLLVSCLQNKLLEAASPRLIHGLDCPIPQRSAVGGNSSGMHLKILR